MKTFIRIDASSLTASHCYLKFYRQVVQGYRSPKIAISPAYGSAWHIFRQILAETNGDAHKAVGMAVGYLKEQLASPHMTVEKTREWMTPGHLTSVCLKYLDKYGSEKSFGDVEFLKKEDGAPLVEQTFSIPLLSNETHAIVVQGTIDEIGKMGNMHCFGDDKTTCSYKADDYLAEHQLKPQLLTYAWALKWAGDKGNNEMLKAFAVQRIGGFINGIFLNKDIDKVFFQRSKIFWFTDERLGFYEKSIMTLARRVLDTVEGCIDPEPEGIINGTCAGNFGRCQYWGVCNAPNDEVSKVMLEGPSFTKSEYKPLHFRKQSVLPTTV